MEMTSQQDSQVQIQENMWIEIIRQMEKMYAELADSQAESERKSRELQEAKEFTDHIIQSMVDGLIVVDAEGTVKMVNKALLHLLGYQENEIIGQPVEILFDDRASTEEPRAPRLQQWTWSEAIVIKNAEVNCRRKTGECIPVMLSGSPIRDSDGEMIGAVAVAKDLRETKALLLRAAQAEVERAKAAELEKAYTTLQQLQAQVIQAEKMASLGKLAAGVAHEINNPLGGILLYSQILLEQMQSDQAATEILEKIIKQATRCKDIVRGLLDFARQAEPSIELHNVNTIAEETLGLLQNQSLFHNIRILKTLDPRIPSIPMDASQIQQVFMNIILNAAEAMEGNGDLTIRTRLTEDHDFVEIEFTDTGCGIPKENLDKIFEPFFTTKSAGKGTGLGLAICYGVVHRHGGTIEVTSEEGKGTTFHIKLPVKRQL